MPQRNPAVNAAGYEDEASWPFKSRFQQELTEQFDFSIIAGTSTMDEDYEGGDRKSTRLNSSHERRSRMPSSA